MQLKQDKMEKFEILNEKENPLLNRKEIEIIIDSNITPKIQEAEELISKKLSVPASNIKIKKIKGKFGLKEFIIVANIYSSIEDKNSIEPKSKKDKKEEVKKE